MKHHFQTPPQVVEYMLSMIPPNSRIILEPTPGTGNIVKGLKENSRYKVHAPSDFFTMPFYRFDCIVMNPPFSATYANLKNAPPKIKHGNIGMRLGYHILKECMTMSDHVISLMPWFTIADSDVRLRFLNDFGIKSITALPRKTFRYTRIQTCIIELHRGWKKPTLFKIFNF